NTEGSVIATTQLQGDLTSQDGLKSFVWKLAERVKNLENTVSAISKHLGSPGALDVNVKPISDADFLRFLHEVDFRAPESFQQLRELTTGVQAREFHMFTARVHHRATSFWLKVGGRATSGLPGANRSQFRVGNSRLADEDAARLPRGV